MEDQPLPADASPTALSPGYVVDSDPEKDEKDPKEDPADYPANRGDNDEDESSNNDDYDDDVEKDEEDKEEEEHLETMTTVNQGMSVEEIEQVVAQQVANAIKAIAIYETKTNLARKSMSQTERQEEKVAENASNKRKWEGNHTGSLSQQNKGHKVPRAHTAWPINKKAYAGSLSLCNQCKFYHSGPCTTKCRIYKKVGHIIQNLRTPATAKNQRTRTCYECGSLRHYKGECPIVKFHERVDMIHRRMRESKPKTMQDAIEIATKLKNKKISTLAECQTKNKKRLDNTSKNNQNQQQPNKRQNTSRAYTVRHGEKKYYSGSKPLCSKCNYHYDGPCNGASQKATCYECGNQGHYRRDCPEQKNQNHENQIKSTKARGVVHAFGGGETEHDLNNIKDEIKT
nr:reverse transcriptase domain-containing protein [Tanacetum cinerariifolium]